MLPDGTVLVFGGVGSKGQVLSSPEFFNPETQSFQSDQSEIENLKSKILLTPRSHHTATLLTDGQVLVAGGVGSNGHVLSSAELFDYETHSSVLVTQSLSTARRSHTATLTDEDKVLLRGGSDANGIALDEGELFDPATQRFTPVDAATLNATPPPGNPILVASIPVSGSVDVPIDTVISLRFSKPLRVETINPNTVTLRGPQGIEAVKVVPAEGGMLAFITPEADLLPGATYSLTVNGALDREGLLLPVSGISFTTQTSGGSGPLPGGDASTSGGPQSKSGPADENPKSKIGGDEEDEWEWKGMRKDGKPHSDWEDLLPLQAPANITALAGQVLDLRGRPLANVTLKIESEYGGEDSSARTDETGRFLITYLDARWSELIIDGRRGHNPRSKSDNSKWGYGVFKYGLDITQGQTNILPFTIWLPKIDTANAVKIPSPTTDEVVVTSPKLPGLELRLAPGTVIRDHDGNVVTEVSLTQIPIDRPPFPLPVYIATPIYFTAQPGDAYIEGYGARVIYPNTFKDLPGARANLWHYTTDGKGWTVYGMGTVTQDRTQVVPDRGVRIYGFAGAMINFRSPGPKPPKCKAGEKCKGGDPLDLSTGLFSTAKSDLWVPDVMPLNLERTYVAEDANSRPFGVGATHPYEIFLWSANQYQEADLILPDQSRIHYVRTSPGTSFSTAVFEHRAPDASCPTCVGSPTKFYGSKIVYAGPVGNNGWHLTLKDGAEYFFFDTGPLQWIRDRTGNQTTLVRTLDVFGTIASILSPNNRWIAFTYDAGNRITQAKDNSGRVVNYEYDASGRLIKVTDPNGGSTEYTYDASHRMLTIKDPRQIVFLTNQYDANGRVTTQTQADGSTYQLAYTLDAGNNVTQVDLTDPRGKVRRTTFNADGYPLSNVYGLGAPESQTITNEWQSGTNLLLSVTDALVIDGQSRKTAYTYDAKGNVVTVTRMAQDPGSAVTTTYTYEPNFNQVATIIDPLNHTTTFGYDAKGNLVSVTNPLNQTTTIARNAAGQPLSITDPLNNTTQFTYNFGDLAATTDPLGNVSSRATDSAGRVHNVTNPLGNPTIYDYDVLNRLTQVLDPLNGTTGFTYDANGNLLGVTDARSNATSYTYDSMDRLATRVDPLTRSESYQYDLGGNMTQFTDRKSQGTSYTYDALSRRTGVTYADTSTTAYTYDAGNRLTQVVDSIAGTITRSYDGLNRLTSETTPQGSVSYTYDAAGRRASMTVSGQSSVVYSYDNANRLTQITQGSSTVTYTYDNAGRRTSLTLPNAVLVEYSYDAASRLTEITYKQNGTTLLGNLTYEYDKNGNRTKIGGSFARTGLPQATTSTAYNTANHQTTFGDKTLIYDNNGNLQTITDGSGTTTYTWSARNQLTGISGPGVSASFVYDAFGRREKKTINGNLTEFLFDDLNVVPETSSAPMLANILTSLNVDEVLTHTDVVLGNTTSVLKDALGSTIALTDSFGAVQTEFSYQPFGQTTYSGALSSNSSEFTGRENDGSGLYYYRARYYQPLLSRFISEDPFACERNKGANLYAYVSNDPINLTDPFGLAPRGGGGPNTCDYYDDRCNRKNNKSAPDPDNYDCNAGRCCRDFGNGPIDRCVRQCLVSNDEVCGELQSGSGACRLIAHVVCYITCFKVPVDIPPSCKKIRFG